MRTTNIDRLAARVEGIRPPVPAANSSDANTVALHTDIAAAVPTIDTHAAPPPAKAADPDGFDYFACKKFGHLYRFAPGSNVGDVNSGGRRWITALILRNEMEPPHKEVHDHGPATEDECRAWLGWPKANPDDHGDGGQPRATEGATMARLPLCVSCGQPRPTNSGPDIVREYARLSLLADIAQLDKQELDYQSEPDTDDEAEWAAYAKWLREYTAADRAYIAAFGAAYEFTKANLPALRAALGGVS